MSRVYAEMYVPKCHRSRTTLQCLSAWHKRLLHTSVNNNGVISTNPRYPKGHCQEYCIQVGVQNGAPQAVRVLVESVFIC